MNFLIIGANSEISRAFINYCHQKNHKTFLVSRNKDLKENHKNVLIVEDYLNDYEKILDFVNDEKNLFVLFFNGALYENRPIRIPTKEEIEFTKNVNFHIPYKLFEALSTSNLMIEKFVFLSSMAALRLRKKNYIYGEYKRKLEEYVLSKSYNGNILIYRFGKVFTNMSLGHTTPPFSLTSQQAAEKIYKNLKKKNIVYPSLGLRLVALLINLTPSYIFRKLKI